MQNKGFLNIVAPPQVSQPVIESYCTSITRGYRTIAVPRGTAKQAVSIKYLYFKNW